MHTHRGAELSKAHPLIKHGNRTHYGKCPDNARRAGMVRARDIIWSLKEDLVAAGIRIRDLRLRGPGLYQ